MSIPYERLIAWAAGPIAILAGWLSTQIVLHFGIFGSLGLGHDQIAHAIVIAVTFLVGAAVTYAAHHKWLDNLAKYWFSPPSALPIPPPGPAPARAAPSAASTTLPREPDAQPPRLEDLPGPRTPLTPL